ncbi:TPA_asm: hypothetical protein GZX72_14370 [Listeria monocytogenes]|nr:hypothetical protein [Listeria monocytogenes]
MKRILAVLMSLVLVVTLASCSNGDKQGEDKGNDKEAKKKTAKKGEMKVGEMMQEDKEHVWFYLDDMKTDSLDKDSVISKFIVTKNGKMTIYKAKEAPMQSLDKLLKMDKEELIKELKNQDEFFFDMKIASEENLVKKDIQNAKDLVNMGYENYIKKGKSHGGKDFALTQKELESVEPEESLERLKKYQSQLEGAEYKEPKEQDVDLQTIGSGELQLTTDRNYPLPELERGNIEDKLTDGTEVTTFNNKVNPKEVAGKRLAGLNNYSEDSITDEGEEPYLLTTVDDDIEKVVLDKGDDPAIKANQQSKHKEE